MIASFEVGEAALGNFGDAGKGVDVFGVLLGRGDKLVGGGLQAAHGGLQAVDITVGEFEGLSLRASWRSVRRSRACSMR